MTGVLIVGSGSSGSVFAATLRRLGATVRFTEPRQHFPDDQAWLASLVRQASGRNYDLAIVSVPPRNIAPAAAVLMRTVRRLIVEKPVALEAEEVRKLSALATEFGAMILVGYHLAVHPLVQRLKDALEQDALGRLTHGRFRMYVPRGRTAGRWLSDDSQSGGPFVELMTHGFHLLQYLVTDLHLECSAIETASARSQAANAFCRAAQGGVFTLEVSSLFDGLGDATAVEIYGTRGSALLRRYGSPRRSELEIRTDADGFSSWKGEMSGDAGFEQLCQLALEDPSAGRRHRPVALETAIEPLEHAIKARALALGGIQ